jgi:hypothetical protein
MAWLTSATVQIEERAVYRWKYQYAVVTPESDDPQNPGFEDIFDMTDTDVVAANVSTGDEVVRRIRVNIVDDRFPGLEKDAAVLQLNILRDNPQYGAATAEWNGAGGYDVVGQRYLVDPEGWSRWIKIQDLDSFSTGGP